MGGRKRASSNRYKISTTLPKELFDKLVERYGKKWKHILERVLVLEEENARLREQISIFSGLVNEIRDSTMRTLGAMNSELGKLKAMLAKAVALVERHERITKDIDPERIEKIVTHAIFKAFEELRKDIQKTSESLEFEKWKYETTLRMLLVMLESRGVINDNPKTLLDAIKAVNERNASIINKILLEALPEADSNDSSE